MKKLSSILWGIVLIVAGVLIALNAANVINVNIFFDGWWTLFIIVPCLIGLFSEKEKTGNIIGLVIGVLLLLASQDILTFELIWKLALPAVIVVVGVKLIWSGIFGNKSAAMISAAKQAGVNLPNVCAIFSGQDVNFSNEVFNGSEITAVFGGVKCDISRAYIEKDCAISVCAVFGGVDIILPEGVNVKVNSNSLFGGVSNKKPKNNDPNALTVYINATCLFGGCDIK